jgi:hypothetical protein
MESERIYMRNSVICELHKISGACWTHGSDGKYISAALFENIKLWDYLENLDIGGRIVFKLILKHSFARIHYAEDRDQWRALVNNIRDLIRVILGCYNIF